MNAPPLEHVFRPARIGKLELPHRILMGPMHLAIESAAGADALASFYVERVRGGAALIVTGGSAVSRVGAGGRHYTFINESSDHPKLRHIARAVHVAGGYIALQLFHAGRYASHEYFGLQPLAPSAMASRFSKSPPRAMMAGDIEQTIEDFARGARRARELGFDAVEIMGSEGYLLNQFLSPLTNRRGDEWGGDFERRTRLPLAVLRAVRKTVGSDFPVIYRLSGSDLMPGSTTDDETRTFARLLAEHGVDAIDVGVGWHESSVPTVQFTVPPGTWVRCAEQIAEAVGPTMEPVNPTPAATRKVPVIASTRIHTLELADRVLADGRVQFIALARPFLADPEIIAKARMGRIDGINLCIACNQACIDQSLQDRPVSCMVNPRAGYELALRGDAPRVAGQPSRSFAVIGGGPAGLEAARVFATLGHRVALYEARSALGGQFQLAGRIPGKADFSRTVDYFAQELRRLDVDVRLRHRLEAASLAELEEYDGVVVASGVVPRRIDLPGVDLPLVRSYPDAVLDGAPTDGPVVIIGAGGIGVDVAHLYSRQGRPVTLLCRGAAIGEHIGRSTRWVLLRELRERNVRMLTGVCYERIVPEGIWIRAPDGTRRLIEARTVVIAAGQESYDPLSRALEHQGRRLRIAGGARTAAELDAVRAFREGALAAHALATETAR